CTIITNHLFRLAASSVLGAPSLSEPKQQEDVDPQQTHEVPVPASHVDHHDFAFQLVCEGREHSRVEKCEHSADQVSGVRRGKDIEKRATGIGGNEYSSIAQSLPGHELASQKAAAEYQGQCQPGCTPLFLPRHSRHCHGGSK